MSGSPSATTIGSPTDAQDQTALVEQQLDRLLDDADPTGPPSEFLGKRFDLGLAWVGAEPGFGGLGVASSLQSLVESRCSAAGAVHPSRLNPLGNDLAAPVLSVHADDDQKARWLRALFTGSEIYCQLFSEPGAGSDLAGLATRAVREGDEWVVNGQKVWTTLGHVAKRGMLVARTDPTAPKHRGLSYFILDMDSPGVEVRPLVQMTGDAEFNEVYLTDVRIPDADRVGEVGRGWSIALATLMNERVAIGGRVRPRGSGMISGLVDTWRSHPGTPAQRDRLVQLWIEAELIRLTSIRAAHQRAAGTPGPEGSLGKLLSSGVNQGIAELSLELLGAEGMLKPGGYSMDRIDEVTAFIWQNPAESFLRTRANSIEGGTTEIMRNMIGEQVLGLPPEARTDKTLPWQDIPRS